MYTIIGNKILDCIIGNSIILKTLEHSEKKKFVVKSFALDTSFYEHNYVEMMLAKWSGGQKVIAAMHNVNFDKYSPKTKKKISFLHWVERK